MVELDQSCFLGYWMKVKIQGLFIIIHILMTKKYKFNMSKTMIVIVIRVLTAI